MHTSAFQKLTNSLINTAFVFFMSLPLLLAFGFDLRYKVLTVGMFLVYQLMAAMLPAHRDLGDLFTGSSWVRDYPIKNRLLFAVLYTLSFSTIFIWLLFPFDVLLLNLLFVQLPMVHKTGYTLHGFLSGKMQTRRRA